MTGVDLDEVRRLCEQASDGPWHTADLRHQKGGQIRVFPKGPYIVANVLASGDRAAGDATFIVAARDLVPALVDEVERLRAEVERLNAVIASRPPFTSPYAGPDEKPCGEPYPGPGRGCELRDQHAVHVRKASGGWDAWITQLDERDTVGLGPGGAR